MPQKKPIIRCWTETSLLVFTKDLKWEGQNGDLKFSPLFPTLDQANKHDRFAQFDFLHASEVWMTTTPSGGCGSFAREEASTKLLCMRSKALALPLLVADSGGGQGQCQGKVGYSLSKGWGFIWFAPLKRVDRRLTVQAYLPYEQVDMNGRSGWPPPFFQICFISEQQYSLSLEYSIYCIFHISIISCDYIDTFASNMAQSSSN